MTDWVKPPGNALRLEVQTDPAPGALVNLIRNPNGDLGGWGWITPVPGSAMANIPDPPADAPTWDQATGTWDTVPSTTTWDTYY